MMEDLKSFDNVFDEPKKGHYLPSKKKRKVKPMVVEEHSNNSMPSTIQLDGTFENLKLWSLNIFWTVCIEKSIKAKE